MSTRIRCYLIAAVVLLLAWPGSSSAAKVGQYGFGASTPGGSRGAQVRVTNLRDDNSAGSLRKVLAGSGNKLVTFALSGTITLKSDLRITTNNITIDATGATSGITLRNAGIKITGRSARDVVLRAITIRNAARDGLAVDGGASNVYMERMSVYGSRDGNLDITQAGTRNVTAAWSVLAEPASPEERNVLIRYGATNISLHHNIFRGAKQRNPDVSYAATGIDPTTTLDMRNNVVRAWRGGQGTHVNHGAKANIVANWYSADGTDPGDGLIICKGPLTPAALLVDCGNTAAKRKANNARAYVSGNHSANGVNFNNRGSAEPGAFSAPFVPTDSAQTAASQVNAMAGAERARH